MEASERKIKITLDTGCINTKPNTNLDKIFDLHVKGEIDLYVPDGVIKDILKNEFSLSNIDCLPNTPRGIKVKERLRKIGGRTCLITATACLLSGRTAAHPPISDPVSKRVNYYG